jgi:hypothetical protein
MMRGYNSYRSDLWFKFRALHEFSAFAPHGTWGVRLGSDLVLLWDPGKSNPRIIVTNKRESTISLESKNVVETMPAFVRGRLDVFVP